MIADAAHVPTPNLMKVWDQVGNKDIPFIRRVVELRLLPANIAYSFFAGSMGLPFEDPDPYDLDPNLLASVPEDLIRRYKAIPLRLEDGIFIVGMENPLDLIAVDSLQETLKAPILSAVVPPETLEACIQARMQAGEGVETLLARLDLGSLGASELGDPKALRNIAGNDVIIKIVDAFVDQGLRRKASDIHIEAGEDFLRVRFRVDGHLETSHNLPKTLHAAILSRVKILSNMDISERRKPQDGRFGIEIKGKGKVEFRVSTLPSVHGEKAVLRILDKRNLSLELTKQGFSEAQSKAIQAEASSPNGLILVTGPTGSGKTTTLYGVLNYLNTDDRNLITVEDPVEYKLRGVTQVQVDSKADRTFAGALRSILRQDPDVIMVGEIRDRETAEISLHASLTGHMVLSTLHTNSAMGTVTRLIDMGTERYLLAPTLRAIVAQRLVRKLCPLCSKPSKPSMEILEQFGLNEDDPRLSFREPTGCPTCRNQGFSGRLPILEVLIWNKELERALASGAEESELLQIAKKTGFQNMMVDGARKSLKGLTTLQEVLSAARF
jgi:type IV pilus assembly protein PilB